MGNGKKQPQYIEAQQLAKEYQKHGIRYTYNSRNKKVYMSIAAAPQFVPDSTDCQLVGYLVFDNVAETRDVDSCVLYVKQQYLLQWGKHPVLAKYADTII